jgi:hypothetical protein
MRFEQLAFIILSIIICSCTNTNKEKDIARGTFSEDNAKELANLFNSSDSVKSIVEEATISFESSYSDSIWKLVHDMDLINGIKPTVHKNESKKWSHCDLGKFILLQLKTP